jgi:hypothetical protein
MKRIASIMLSVAFLVACNSFAKDAPKANSFNKILSKVPAAELPAKAADLVSQAKPGDREVTTVNVVKCAVGINPAAAPAIVGAIAQAVPEMAPVAAGAAATEQPKQASAIAKAAAAAAPSQAAAIVTAVCRVAPKEYRNVAVAVSQVVPATAGKDIVTAVEVALPNLKPSLEKVMAGSGGNVASVGDTLAQAAQVAQTGSASAQPTTVRPPMLSRGPAVGQPYIPLQSTPTNVTSGTSGQLPEGGRNYASP